MREKNKIKEKKASDVPSVTLEAVMRENPGISIPDAFQKLNALRAQEDAQSKGPTPATVAAPAPGGTLAPAAVAAVGVPARTVPAAATLGFAPAAVSAV